jgi:1-acyl-sn-glycerol-3-phosphate acyltransferase
MFRTVMVLAIFVVFMLICLPLAIPYYLMNLLRLRRASNAYITFLLGVWSNLMLFVMGCRFTVVGKENLPEAKNLVFISNHQGFFDIPAILAASGRKIGFIAKKELAYFPFINLWMPGIGCLFLDRKSPRKALAVFQKAINRVKDGNAMLVFPEGHRSRGDRASEFKRGSLKLPLQSGAIIVPVTIDGTWHMLEEKGYLRPAKVTLTIHPPVYTAALSAQDKESLCDRLRETIVSKLPSQDVLPDGQTVPV